MSHHGRLLPNPVWHCLHRVRLHANVDHASAQHARDHGRGRWDEPAASVRTWRGNRLVRRPSKAPEGAHDGDRARLVVCGPFDDKRCFDFPDRPESATETCDTRGRCRIGWLTNGGRETFDAWLDTATGEGRLKAWPKER